MTAPKRIVLIGDIHGAWRRVADLLRDAVERHGPLDAAFAVGDVQAVRSEAENKMVRHAGHREHVAGDFPDFVAGGFDLPVPVHFIGGNHEPWEALDAQSSGDWAAGVRFLGRSGVTEVTGLTVAYLSGIYSPRVSPLTGERKGIKDRTYWNADDLAVLEAQADGRSIDLLLTHDWPAGLSHVPGRPIRWNEGHGVLASLAERLRPTVYAAGHHHRVHREQMSYGGTFMGLADVRRGVEALAVVEIDGRGRAVELPLPAGPLGAAL